MTRVRLIEALVQALAPRSARLADGLLQELEVAARIPVSGPSGITTVMPRSAPVPLGALQDQDRLRVGLTRVVIQTGMARGPVPSRPVSPAARRRQPGLLAVAAPRAPGTSAAHRAPTVGPALIVTRAPTVRRALIGELGPKEARGLSKVRVRTGLTAPSALPARGSRATESLAAPGPSTAAAPRLAALQAIDRPCGSGRRGRRTAGVPTGRSARRGLIVQSGHHVPRNPRVPRNRRVRTGHHGSAVVQGREPALARAPKTPVDGPRSAAMGRAANTLAGRIVPCCHESSYLSCHPG